MPVAPRGDLKVVSVVLTREQDERLRALHSLRAAEHRRRNPGSRDRLSLSDVAREVVEAGLDAVSRGPNSDFVASGDNGRAA